jgi:hypothetical protein
MSGRHQAGPATAATADAVPWAPLPFPPRNLDDMESQERNLPDAYTTRHRCHSARDRGSLLPPYGM